MFDKIIKENQFKTKCVIAIYLLIFVLIGLLADIVRINARSLGEGLYQLLTFAKFPLITAVLLVVAALVVCFAIFNFKRILLNGNEYKEILQGKEANAKERELSQILDELIVAANLPFRPKLFLMEAPFMNAFASGWEAKNSLIALTTTLVHNLSREETKAVMAHELSHIRHGDIRLTLVVGILSNIMLLVVNYGVRQFSVRNSRQKGAQMAYTLLAILQFVLPLLTLVLQMFLSRSREYMADSGAAYLMNDNAPMIRALQKISGNYAQSDFSQNDNPTRTALYIFSPKEMFSTHPSIENRIAALLQK